MLFILFKKKNRSSAHKILIRIFILIFLVLLCYYGYLHKIYSLLIITYIFIDAFDVFIGPLLYVYVRSVTGNPVSSVLKNGLYFVFPCLLILCISVPAILLMVNDTFNGSVFDSLNTYFSFKGLYSLGFIIAAYYQLLRFQKLVKHNYSNLENKDLQWAKVFLLGVMVIIAIDIFTSVYEIISPQNLYWGMDLDYLTVVLGIFLLVYLGYYGISQATILVPDFLVKESLSESINLKEAVQQTPKKYQYNTKEMKELGAQLTLLMEEERPYLMEDLTLYHLSKELATTDKKLSVLLNQHMHISFYDYINTFRIDEVKQKINDKVYSNYTLLAIAYECGFKSKTSFNRIFKKNTGVSPSQYKKTP